MRVVRVGSVISLFGAAAAVLFGAAAAVCQDAGKASAVTAVPAIGLDIPGLIRDVGFPAAAFIALFWLVRTTLNENTKAIQELRLAVTELRVLVQAMGGHKE